MSAGGLISDNSCPPVMLLLLVGEVLGGSYCPIKVQSTRVVEIGVCKPPSVKMLGILLLLLTGDVLNDQFV